MVLFQKHKEETSIMIESEDGGEIEISITTDFEQMNIILTWEESLELGKQLLGITDF